MNEERWKSVRRKKTLLFFCQTGFLASHIYTRLLTIWVSQASMLRALSNVHLNFIQKQLILIDRSTHIHTQYEKVLGSLQFHFAFFFFLLFIEIDHHRKERQQQQRTSSMWYLCSSSRFCDVLFLDYKKNSVRVFFFIEVFNKCV